MKNFRFLLTAAMVAMLALCLVAGCSDDDDDDDDNNPVGPSAKTTIEIGAIIPFSGDYGQNGPVFLASLQCAVEDVNAELEAAGKDTAVRLVYGDSMTDPMAANVLLNTFILQNVRAVVGPITSGEVEGVSDLIGSSDSFLVSPSATSTALEGENDHIFRLVSDDSRMAEALAERMIADGISHVIMIARDDNWGNSVSASVAEAFAAKGGTVVDTARYFGLRSSIVREMLEQVEASLATTLESVDTSKIAIHLSSYDEGSMVFESAAENEDVKKVRWYGSDGFVKDAYLAETPELADFAVSVNYTAPIFRISTTDDSTSLAARIEEKAGVTPGTYPMLAYDAMRVAANALVTAGADADYTSLEAAVFKAAGEYNGVTGTITLNASGDRTDGDYSFFSLKKSGDAYSWVGVD